MTCRVKSRSFGGLYLESTRAEQLGVLPGEDRPIREVMDRRIVFKEASSLVREAIQTMQHERVATLVVQDRAVLYGLVTELDLLIQYNKLNPSTMTLKDVLPRQHPITCCEDDMVADALLLMQRTRVAAVPVINQQGGVTGLISLTDVAASVAPDAATVLLNEVRK